jgi:hypothetical protein
MPRHASRRRSPSGIGAIAGGGWGASIGLAAIVAAVVVGPGFGRSTSEDEG